MSAHCGSRSPEHVARRCPACKSVYQRRYREGAAPVFRRSADPATCAVCGVAAGNSLGIRVLRYPLTRHIGTSTTCIGSFGLCDSCILELGNVKEKYRPTMAPDRRAA